MNIPWNQAADAHQLISFFDIPSLTKTQESRLNHMSTAAAFNWEL